MTTTMDSDKHTNQMDNYWRTRDFKTSARLHLQHWLFQSSIGFALHPTITTSLEARDDAQPLRIADLGCGNGAWLIEVAQSVQHNAELHGFDIQPVHFPAKRNLLENIHFSKTDILNANSSADLAKSFDVVHIRAFGSLIRNSDCSAVLESVTRLLKPGGWLQWEEADSSAMTATAGEAGLAGSCTGLLQVIQAGGRATGTTFDWLGNIGEQVAAAAFEEVEVSKFPLRPEQYKAWTENYLLVYEEVAMMLPSEKDAPGAPMTREKYEALFDAVVKETNAGAVIHSQHLIVVVGKKSV